MAVLAKDTDTPPTYWGGWPYLAPALGFTSYDVTAKRAIARAVRELADAGLIKAHGSPGPGHNVTYQLVL